MLRDRCPDAALFEWQKALKGVESPMRLWLPGSPDGYPSNMLAIAFPDSVAPVTPLDSGFCEV